LSRETREESPRVPGEYRHVSSLRCIGKLWQPIHRTRRRSGTPVPFASATKSTSRGRRPSCRTAHPRPQARTRKRRCLEMIVAALAELDARPEHVVRTRVYVTSADDWEEIGRAHGEVFGSPRPSFSATPRES
jgi:Endoribonuclease L-PSP